ncbi:MAG TPA: hypothetical protein VMY78_06300 [Solirubrobacteraceae bacterium]|nr:hypothetical protein [Solirubrobacteraceae bacterium]
MAAVTALIVTGGLVGGCGDDDEGTTAKKPAAAPVAFSVQATAEGKKQKALEFPATIKAGLVNMTLKNDDSVARSAQFLRVTGDQTVEDVLKVVNADETKIPDFMQDGGGIANVAPGKTGTASQVLVPGRYVIWDDLGGDEDDAPGYDELGAKGEFTVTGPAVDAELPAQPATVTTTDDLDAAPAERYGFAFEGLKAGTNRVRFENTGTQLHHALFLPIRKGVTIEEVGTAFSSDEEPEGPPPVDFAKSVGTVVIDGDIAQNITLDLAAGRYAVICFLSDRKGGKPHVAQGMIEELTVE